MKTLTMVVRHGFSDEKNDRLYTLIDEGYKLSRVQATEVKELLLNGVVITNLGIEDGRVVSTNGAMEKYTRIDANNIGLLGKPSPVVLNRVESDEKLIGYTIYNIDGTLLEVSVEQAVGIHKKRPFANGKLKETQQGPIISSINGRYPLRTISMKKASTELGEVKVRVRFITALKGVSEVVSHAGVMVKFDKATDYTKLYKLIEVEREKLLIGLKDAGVEDMTPYDTQLMRGGFYTVVPLKLLYWLIEQSNIKLDKQIVPTVSAMKILEDDIEETVIKLSKDFKAEKIFKSLPDLDELAAIVYKEVAVSLI